MSVFHGYAQYYDLLYRDKDYRAEAEYVRDLIRRHSPHADRILELGCGTGAHAQELARLGFGVHGVDLSVEMLERAEERRKSLPRNIAEKLSFGPGDVRVLRLPNRFPVVIALFHVLSYQTTNEELDAAFDTARRHLEAEGIFVFDCWYGPAVLTNRPEVRVKRLADNGIAVTRLAEPVMEPNANVVNVNYTVFIKSEATGVIEDLREVHRMRYLFTPEIEALAGRHGFGIAGAWAWMTQDEPSLENWGACFALRLA